MIATNNKRKRLITPLLFTFYAKKLNALKITDQTFNHTFNLPSNESDVSPGI